VEDRTPKILIEKVRSWPGAVIQSTEIHAWLIAALCREAVIGLLQISVSLIAAYGHLWSLGKL
jgi:hypothetical protein